MTDEPKPYESPAAEAAPSTEPVPAPIPDAQPDAPKSEDTPRPSRGSAFDRRVLGLGLAAGLGLVALLLALMVFAPQIAPVRFGAVADAQRAEREQEVEEVATNFASSLYSFSYQTIDDDLEKIRSYSTGNFSKELASVIGEGGVRLQDAIVDARGESRGVVEGVDVRELKDDTATARVFVNQAISNKKNPTPRTQFAAVELTLVETRDGWKVDDVQQFTSAAPQASPKG